MATIPANYTITNVSVDVLNAIRNEADTSYKNYVPIATPDADSIRKIGAVIMDSPDLRNQFVTALVNRIGRVLVMSKMYDNPLKVLKKGVLEFGEVIENVFIELAKPFQYNPAEAVGNVFKRENPDVRVAFHVMNYQKFYKDTIDDKQLSLAFLTWDGVTDFINRIINTMYTAAEYDEFLVTKYMIAREILNGRIGQIGTFSTNKAAVTSARAVSNKFTFMSPNYNIAGVRTHTPKDRQYIIMTADFEAETDVDVLAAAFNMDKAEFYGRRLVIDGFDQLDSVRLNELLGAEKAVPADPGNVGYTKNFVEFTDAELTLLGGVKFVIVDEDYFMIYDNFIEFVSLRNPEGVSWNYWLHTWKTFSVNPFGQAAYLGPNMPGITLDKYTVELDLSESETASITATTIPSGETVTWSSTDTSVATVSSGTITPVAVGTCQVKASITVSGITHSKLVNVKVVA